MTRKLTAYEANVLIKNGVDLSAIENYPSDFPIEYIVKSCEFRDEQYFIDENVLIPRIETEDIINIALKNLKNSTKIRFWDIGTGSGVIGISFALELLKKNISFDAFLTDKSEKALNIARRNSEVKFRKTDVYIGNNVNLFWDSKKKVVRKIVLSKLSEIDVEYLKTFLNLKNSFDFIFANLPYIPTDRISTLQNSVKNFEPKLALDGGSDGLDIIRRYLKILPYFLKDEGLAILEVDDTHTPEMVNEAYIYDISEKKDCFGKNRFWILKKRNGI